MSSRSVVVVCLFVALAAAGCGRPKVTPVVVPAAPQEFATAAELAAAVNARSDSVRTVRADLDISFRRSPGAKVRRCSGKLFAERGAEGASASIYLKGYKTLAPTFFTLVSDGAEFWLHVPSRNTVYTGPVYREVRRDTASLRPDSAGSVDADSAASAVDLEAADLSRALFVEPIDTALDCRLSVEGGDYVLDVMRDGAVHRRLRIERIRLSVVGETYYTPEGAGELELRRSGFAVAGSAIYPRHVAIERPGSGREVDLDIVKLSLKPPDRRAPSFTFAPPRGVKIERIE